ncbi:MAG: hypothetical protein QOK20_1688, partial [Acidimicrobiaceae bacterium]|nr:hypothetical protein [Acidimicrobiaceae bacterium]
LDLNILSHSMPLPVRLLGVEYLAGG